MKKRPFKKKLERRPKRLNSIRKIIFHPMIDYVDAYGFMMLTEGIQLIPGGITGLEYRHFHPRKYQGEIPFRITEENVDLGQIEGDQKAEFLMRFEELPIWKKNAVKGFKEIRNEDLDNDFDSELEWDDEPFVVCKNCEPRFKCMEAGCVEKQELTEFYKRVK